VPSRTRRPRLDEDAGAGRAPDFSDRAFWLPDDAPEVEMWVNALHALDHDGQVGPLCDLFRTKMPAPVGEFLVDLIERHRLKRYRGKKMPLYNPNQKLLLLATDRVKEYRDPARGAARMSVRDALAKAAADFGVDEDALSDLHHKRQRGMREWEKRLRSALRPR
jgi:hypothetical protein